tara:strand:- start:30787 stop:31164 length:378 start_codon:yes stop_codon:yes gene_type:complete
MNYESMSDFEVNKEVANLLDAKFMLDEFVFGNEEREVVYLCEKDGIDSIFPVCEFNPCGNPSDAWPIIIENEISIVDPISCGLDKKWMASKFYPKFNKKDIDWDDKNPLRAAMIVFLRMNEGEVL